MCRLVNKKSLILFILSILLVFTTINAQSQEEESSDNQPSYINELVDNSQLTQSQVTQMRNNGESWGNIKLRVQMAERIAANNPDTGTAYEQRYQDALNQISQQRATGKGFGDIANENNFKVGDVIGNGNGNAVQNQQRNRAMSENQNQEQVQTRQQTQTQAQVQTQTKAKKKGLLGRFFGIFGIGKKEKKQESAQTKNALKNEKTQENANKKQTQESSGKSQTKGSQNKVQTQQNTSNQVQNRNSSSSQNVRTQERTQTNQRNRTQSGNSGSGNTFRNQGFGGGAGRTGGGGGRGR